MAIGVHISINTSDDLLSTMDVALLQLGMSTEAHESPVLNGYMSLVELSPFSISPKFLEPFRPSPNVPTMNHLSFLIIPSHFLLV